VISRPSVPATKYSGTKDKSAMADEMQWEGRHQRDLLHIFFPFLLLVVAYFIPWAILDAELVDVV